MMSQLTTVAALMGLLLCWSRFMVSRHFTVHAWSRDQLYAHLQPCHLNRFEEAAEQIKGLTQRPTDEELLELYALFKQGSLGDNNTDKPGMFDLKGKYKWEYWNKKKGTSKQSAQEDYIKYVQTLLEKYS